MSSTDTAKAPHQADRGTCSSSPPAWRRRKVFPLVGRFQMHFITQYLLGPHPPYTLGHVGPWFHEHLLCAHYRPGQFHTTSLHFCKNTERIHLLSKGCMTQTQSLSSLFGGLVSRE